MDGDVSDLGHRADKLAKSRPAVLVTGAAGFIGHHTAMKCAQLGWDVTAVDVRPRPDRLADPVTFKQVDFAAPALLDAVAEGAFDAIVHQAADSDSRADDTVRLRTLNTDNVLALAEACAASSTLLVYASSSSVYGRIHERRAVPESAVDDRAFCTGPQTPYAWSKYALDESMARRYSDSDSFAWYGLRYTNVFGPYEEHKGAMASIISQLLRATAAGGPLEVFADTLEAARDYAPVAFVVDVATRLVTAGAASGFYNVGSGYPISFSRVLEWCHAFAGRDALDVKLKANPFTAKYQYWTCADVAKLLHVLPGLKMPCSDDIRAAALGLYREFAAAD